MKIKDLADGVTYNFRIRAKTLTYGPEVEANITTGPGEGGMLQLFFITASIIESFEDSLVIFYPPFLFSQELQALQENPLFLDMAQLSHCIGQVAIKAVHPSRDTS